LGVRLVLIGLSGEGLVEVIDKFLRGLTVGIGEFEFEFSFLGPEDNGLPFHAADHVERSAGLTAQGHLQEVFLDASLDGFAQLALDFEEAVGRTKSADALMRALVVVISDPELDPLTGGIKALELGPAQELLPERFPEAFDLSERHGMLRTRLEVGHPILFQLRFKTGGAPP